MPTRRPEGAVLNGALADGAENTKTDPCQPKGDRRRHGRIQWETTERGLRQPPHDSWQAQAWGIASMA